MNIDQLREFVALENEGKGITDRLKAIKQRQDELEEALIPQFIADGLDATQLDGRIIAIKQTTIAFPRAGEHKAVLNGFKNNPDPKVAAYVKEDFNVSSISKWVREIERDVRETCAANGTLCDEAAIEAALPEPLNRVLQVSFIYKLSATKGK
jgi:hypothetical protein